MDRRARERLVLENDSLACSLAWKFRWSGEDVEDLRQVAREALVIAAKRFDPSQGTRFGTYAFRVVWGRLKHYIRDESRLIRHPRSAHRDRRPHLRMVSLEALLGPEDVPAEFEARLGVVEPGFEAVETTLAVRQMLQVMTEEERAALAAGARRLGRRFSNRAKSKLGGALPVSRHRGRPVYRPAEKVA